MTRCRIRCLFLLCYIILIPYYISQNPNAIHTNESMEVLLLSSIDVDEKANEHHMKGRLFVKKFHLSSTVQNIVKKRKPEKSKTLLTTINGFDRNGKTTSKLNQVDRFNKQGAYFYKYKLRNVEHNEPDLGWSQWSEWTCPVTCGGGIGKRVRVCETAGQNFCKGPKEETGPCNEQLCPDVLYTLSPETKSEADEELRENIPGYFKKENESIQMSCNSDMLNSIWSEYPNMKVSWLKNGRELNEKETRLKIAGPILKIKNLVSDDNGVYICRTDFASRSSQAVSMSVLSVQSPGPSLTFAEKSSMTLVCNGFMLSRVLSNLNQKWIHNGTIHLDFQESSPLNHNELNINSATLADNGVWECKITDAQSTRSWITNRIIVRIIPAQSFRDKIRKHIVKIAIAVGGLLLLLIIIFTVPRLFKSSDTRQMEAELKRLQGKKRLEQKSKKAEEAKLLQEKQEQELKMQAEKSKLEQVSKAKIATIKPSLKKPIPTVREPMKKPIPSSREPMKKPMPNARENVSKMLEKTLQDNIPFNAFGVNEYTLRMKYKEKKKM